MSTKGTRRGMRKRPVVYGLRPIGVREGLHEELDLEVTDQYHIGGEIKDHLIVSVPPTISHNAARNLRVQLSEGFGRPVIIVTHNIEFLEVTRLSSKQALAVAKRLYVPQGAEVDDGESVSEAGDGDGDGRGSGVRQGGRGGLTVLPGGADRAGEGAGAQDGEGREEGSIESARDE